MLRPLGRHPKNHNQSIVMRQLHTHLEEIVKNIGYHFGSWAQFAFCCMFFWPSPELAQNKGFICRQLKHWKPLCKLQGSFRQMLFEFVKKVRAPHNARTECRFNSGACALCGSFRVPRTPNQVFGSDCSSIHHPGQHFYWSSFCLLLFCLPKAAHITPPLANLWAICKECDETGTFMAATPCYSPLVIKIPTEFLLRLCEAE